MSRRTIGLVGARGYTGRELLALLSDHDGFDLAFASSRHLAGTPIADRVEGYDSETVFEEVPPEDAADARTDALVLALPNDRSRPYVEAIDRAAGRRAVVDISSDHRFDDDWQYGQPERFRGAIEGSRRVANPGCYATGAQLALAPFSGELDGTPKVFGVSGYSGAGTSPSPRNDEEKLRDNLLPYSLTNHTHEREVSEHLGRPIHFTPHVAEFFRGISLTVSMDFADAYSADELRARLADAYADEPLVELSDDIPLVRDNANEHHATVGGLQVGDDGHHAVAVATLDNLLKGAATQALQNLNVMCGFDEFRGIPVPVSESHAGS